MIIKIKDTKVCESCQHRTCSVSDVVERSSFYKLKSEKYTCPLKLLQYGPNDKQLEAGYMDVQGMDAECIHCFLCSIQCSKYNIDLPNNAADSLLLLNENVTNNDISANNIVTVMATSFLNHIFDFSANTNLNKALSFDGYVCMKTGDEAFVEVDVSNDSLESCRRILADILLYDFRHEDIQIKNGIIVLSNFPREGSRDIFTLIQNIRSFPATANLNIFITTISLLRYFALHIFKNQCTYKELFFNIAEESLDVYKNRLLLINVITTEAIENII